MCVVWVAVCFACHHQLRMCASRVAHAYSLSTFTHTVCISVVCYTFNVPCCHQAAGKASFRQRVRVEQELVDGSAADIGCEAALDLMHQVRGLKKICIGWVQGRKAAEGRDNDAWSFCGRVSWRFSDQHPCVHVVTFASCTRSTSAHHAQHLTQHRPQGGPLQSVLRLLCLVSITQGGIPKRQFDPLRRELLLHFGHQHLLTLTALYDAGRYLCCCLCIVVSRQ